MIQFTDDCMIGIENLDNEHRHLFDLMAQVMYLLQSEYMLDRHDQIKHLLQELEDYADSHFAHEEAYMKEICDPELIRQRVQHTFFRERVHAMNIKNISDDEEQENILEEMVQFLAKWLYNHIIGSDIMIGKLPPLEKWMMKENPCEFSEDFLVGVEMIDAEHRKLFRIIEDAYQLVIDQVDEEHMEEIVQVLTELKKYTVEHFGDEERYMESIHYEGLEAQKRAHAAFVSRLDEVTMDKLGTDAQRYMEALIEFLLGWLINHIVLIDKKIPGNTVVS